MIRFAVIGAGDRGRQVYAHLLCQKGATFVAAVDPDPERRQAVQREFGLSDEALFENTDDFFARLDQDLFINTLVIAPPDRAHYAVAMKALDYDLHILLEKPISVREEEVRDIARKAEDHQQVFMICHVLRYAPVYRKIKELIDSGAIGDIMSINHNENIGYYHFAHSFVRGNWSNEEKSSPLILQKSCHDMDLMLYLTGKKPLSLKAYGELSYFNAGHRPNGAADRCVDCPFQDTCLFSAVTFYRSLPETGWRLVVTEKRDDQSLMEALRTGPYGRCVWASDNDVCDHQAVAMEFEGGILAVFNLTAFSNEIHRNIKIQGTEGEIIADDAFDVIEVRRFGENKKIVYDVTDTAGGHGGGDQALMDAFVAAVHGEREQVKSGARESVLSHLMCFAAEQSRLQGITIDMKNYLGK